MELGTELCKLATESMTRNWKSTTRPVVGQTDGSQGGGSDRSPQPGRRHPNPGGHRSPPRNQQPNRTVT
ncbi:hypothetical protein U1Q18_035985 [Sarracenia purpurea var. burkii]